MLGLQIRNDEGRGGAMQAWTLAFNFDAAKDATPSIGLKKQNFYRIEKRAKKNSTEQKKTTKGGHKYLVILTLTIFSNK